MANTPAATMRRMGGFALAAGAVFLASGTAAWALVTKQLREEEITVPPNADFMAGKRVQDPLSAYAEAATIQRNALKASGGRSFAQITAAVREAEPGSEEAAKLRQQGESLTTAASLRSALMTSVLAYGVSALVGGIGALLLCGGTQLVRARDEE